MKCSECKKEFYIKIKDNRDDYLGKSVIQYTPQGVEKNRFKSAKEASEKTGINRIGIGNCCRGKVKTAGGYVWEFTSKN